MVRAVQVRDVRVMRIGVSYKIKDPEERTTVLMANGVRRLAVDYANMVGVAAKLYVYWGMPETEEVIQKRRQYAGHLLNAINMYQSGTPERLRNHLIPDPILDQIKTFCGQVVSLDQIKTFFGEVVSGEQVDSSRTLFGMFLIND